MIKVLVFGCQQIAVDVIKHLMQLEDVEIPLVVTYELPMDITYKYESVSERASDWGLNVKQPRRIDAALIEEVQSYEPDIILSIYYRKIFPKALIEIPKAGCVNIHPGLLPFYRGATPTAWAIHNGEKKFGVTIHYMDEGIDTGDILVQEEFPIMEDETGYELYTRSMQIGADMLNDNFYKIVNREIVPRKQKGCGSYFGKRSPKFIIDWQQRAESIKNIVRVHAKPFNPAETRLLNKYVFINRVSILQDDRYPSQSVGRIVDIWDNEKLVVSCADGCIVFEDYEMFPVIEEHERAVYMKIGNRFEC